MKLSPREAAVKTILEVLEGRSLNHVLVDIKEKVRKCDQGLVSELTFGTCRYWFQLETLLHLLLKKPLKSKSSHRLIIILLSIALYQLLNTRSPDYAVITESVKITRVLGLRWASSLVNAVLRRFQREKESLLKKIFVNDAAYYSLPVWLLSQIKEDWPEQWRSIVKILMDRPPMTLRVNLLYFKLNDYANLLTSKNWIVKTVNNIPTALILDKPIKVRYLPYFKEGAVSVQDAGAQLAARILDAQPGDEVLDVCAAPGGKSCHILEQQPKLASLTAVDIELKRLSKIHQNLNRLNVKVRARVLLADATQLEGKWRDRFYDRILLDIPCSATGVIRRHPDIKLLRRDKDIDQVIVLQKKILESVWPLLKNKGRLIYCTCSLLARENYLQIKDFIRNHTDAISVIIKLPKIGLKKSIGIQILPNKKMDGFYYACLEKRK